MDLDKSEEIKLLPSSTTFDPIVSPSVHLQQKAKHDQLQHDPENLKFGTIIHDIKLPLTTVHGYIGMVLDKFNSPESISDDVDQNYVKEIINGLNLHSDILSRLAKCYEFSTSTEDKFHYKNNIPANALLDPETGQTVSDFVSFIISLRLQENPNGNPDAIKSELDDLAATFPPGSRSRHLLLAEIDRCGNNIMKIFEAVGLQSRESAELGLKGRDFDNEVFKLTSLANFSQLIIRSVNRVIAMNRDAKDILEMDHYTPKIEEVSTGSFFDQYFVNLLTDTRAIFQYHRDQQLEGLKVRIDRKIVAKTLDNLVSNMTKYGMVNSKGEKIEESPIVKVEAANGRLLVTFQDFGLGIDPQYVKRFNHNIVPGRMVSNTKVEGTGFGLYGCRLLLAETDSTLTVNSTGPDQGSTFTLSLPLVSNPSI